MEGVTCEGRSNYLSSVKRAHSMCILCALYEWSQSFQVAAVDVDIIREREQFKLEVAAGSYV